MQLLPKIQSKAEHFKSWECFVVWNKDAQIIRKILAFYNRVNHFQNFNPTWAKNIIGARFMWEKMGCPPLDKEPPELGKVITNNWKPVKEMQSCKKFKMRKSFNSA